MTAQEKRGSLLPEERRNKIVEVLNNSGSAKSNELSRMYDVTEETIRKDLEVLSEKGLILRTFGGAMSFKKSSSDDEPSFELRNTENPDEKEKIGEFAARLINPRDTIVLDASSTNLKLARYIPEGMDIVVITNALAIMVELASRDGVTVIATGGVYRNKSKAYIGALAESSLDRYNINKAFMSSKAVSSKYGLMDIGEQEAAFKKKMLDRSIEKILVADYSKFQQMACITVCPINRFDKVISDSRLDKGEISELQKLGIEVLTV